MTNTLLLLSVTFFIIVQLVVLRSVIDRLNKLEIIRELQNQTVKELFEGLTDWDSCLFIIEKKRGFKAVNFLKEKCDYKVRNLTTKQKGWLQAIYEDVEEAL